MRWWNDEILLEMQKDFERRYLCVIIFLVLTMRLVILREVRFLWCLFEGRDFKVVLVLLLCVRYGCCVGSFGSFLQQVLKRSVASVCCVVLFS